MNPSKDWTIGERLTLTNDLRVEIMRLVCVTLPNSGHDLTKKLKIIDRLDDCGRRIGFLNSRSSTFLETNRDAILNGKAPSVE